MQNQFFVGQYLRCFGFPSTRTIIHVNASVMYILKAAVFSLIDCGTRTLPDRLACTETS